MRRADVDVGFRGHARVADAVGAAEAAQVILLRNGVGVAQVLDQFQGVAEREDFRAVDVLDVVGQAPHVAVESEDVAEGIVGCHVLLDDLGAELGHALVDQGLALLDLAADFEALLDFVLLGHLEAHDIAVFPWCAVKREARRIRSAMLQGPQHGGHFPADLAGLASVNQSSYAAHGSCISSGYGRQWR